MAERSEMDIEIAVLSEVVAAADQGINETRRSVAERDQSTLKAIFRDHFLVRADEDQANLRGAKIILDILGRKRDRWDLSTGGVVELPRVSNWEEGDI